MAANPEVDSRLHQRLGRPAGGPLPYSENHLVLQDAVSLARGVLARDPDHPLGVRILVDWTYGSKSWRADILLSDRRQAAATADSPVEAAAKALLAVLEL